MLNLYLILIIKLTNQLSCISGMIFEVLSSIIARDLAVYGRFSFLVLSFSLKQIISIYHNPFMNRFSK